LLLQVAVSIPKMMQAKDEKKDFDSLRSLNAPIPFLSSSVPLQPLPGMKKQQTPAFLEKLFDILENESAFHHLISWQPDGNSFIIKKVNEFSETVLPKYFKHSNIQSYIRQLNMYGFSKTRHDSNHHEFTHKLFQRGRRDLLPFIRRKTQSNSHVSHSSGGNPTAQSPEEVTIAGGLKRSRPPLPPPHRRPVRSSSENSQSSGSAHNTININNNNNNNNNNVKNNNHCSPEQEDEYHEYNVHSSNYLDNEEEDEDIYVMEEREEPTALPFPISSSSSTSGQNQASMEKRIIQLEKQVIALTEFSLDLLKNHNHLCEALQGVLSSSSDGCPTRMKNGHERVDNRTEEEEDQVQVTSISSHTISGPDADDIDHAPPLKRMKSMDGSFPVGGSYTDNISTTVNEELILGKQKRFREQELDKQEDRGHRLMDVNFLDYLSHKTLNGFSSLLVPVSEVPISAPVKTHPVIQFPTKNSQNSNNIGNISNIGSPRKVFSPTRSSSNLPGMKLERKSYSVDQIGLAGLVGLEAITAAAQFLDYEKVPVPLSSSNATTTSDYGSLLLSRNSSNNNLSGSGNSVNNNNGQPMVKSYSCGYNLLFEYVNLSIIILMIIIFFSSF
jgi:hypothetical protein